VNPKPDPSAQPPALTTAFVCLPMYDPPWLHAQHDALWSLIRADLVETGLSSLPRHLRRESDYASSWTDPALLLGQTCGYPYVSRLRGRVKLVCTPCYSAEGCSGPCYRSLLITGHRNGNSLMDFEDRRFVANDPDSLSGYKTVEMMLPDGLGIKGFFNREIFSGGHLQSIQQIKTGLADIAAIDCVTWALTRRYQPHLIKGLRIIEEGPLLPALPLITSAQSSEDTLTALQTVLCNMSAHRDLLIDGYRILQDEDYDVIRTRLEERANALFTS